MSWRDFFYFSKGERRGLVLLLCLIIAAGVVLILTNPPSADENDEIAVSTSENALQSTDSNTSQREEPTVSNRSAGNRANVPSQRDETVAERVKRLTDTRPNYPRSEKLASGATVELNAADTTMLKKVPGIGPAFANRIVKYRNLLGGFANVQQLSEVYGIDEEKYAALSPWFTADKSHIRRLAVNSLPEDSLRRHPYIDYRQAKAIARLRKQKGSLSGWENLQLLEEFTEADKQRLMPYLSFE